MHGIVARGLLTQALARRQAQSRPLSKASAARASSG